MTYVPMADRSCVADSCDRAAWSKNMCLMHYRRWKKYGDPNVRKRVSSSATLLEHLEFYGWTTTAGGCWEWNGHREAQGYGNIERAGVAYKVHRVMYELHVGSIPEGMLIRHKCDNRPCVNPDHLEVGFDADNVRDRDERGRLAHGERSGAAKLTNSQVREIRVLLETVPVAEIARRFDVSYSAISGIKNNRYWKRVA